MLDLIVEFFPWDCILWTMQENEIRLQLYQSYK